ncbi:hypothetical protein BGZ49_008404 [Haplosporangium sp. Z 27]|nr:hypothetical protein BGZ49_008404 [Haplosporangium sp. Z 27]
MDHNTMTYYQDHDEEEYEELQVDEDEEYQEDLFLKQHYGRPGLGGLGLVHDDDDSDDDLVYNSSNNSRRHQYQYRHHGVQNNFDHDDIDEEDEESIEVELDGHDDEYNEVDMDQHNIHLLSGSLSIRSPFLDAIREEEDEEPVFAKPSSYPTLGTGKHFQRLNSGADGVFSSWMNRGSLGMAVAEKQIQQKQQQNNGLVDQQQSNFNNTNQSDSSKPRGPRPPLMLGQPRTNSSSSLTRVTTGFDIPSSSSGANDLDVDKDKAFRESQMSPENPIQDLEVKRVLEGAAALASATSTTSPALINDSNSADTTPLPSTSSIKLGGRTGANSTSDDPTASFGQDTQKSIDDFFGMVKADLDKRIQEAIQEVEQKFLHRVQKLEEHTAALAGAPSEDDLASVPKSGSLMESLTRPLPADQNPGGSLALRKEILSHVTEKVGDLDLRVNQMEVLVSYKLVDIESKVQDLHGAHNSIAQKVHQVAKSHKSNMQGVVAGDGVGENTITAEEARVSKAMQPYRDIDAEGKGAEAFLEPVDGIILGEGEGVVSLRRRGTAASTASRADETSRELVDTSSSIVELRNELHALGMRYQELNDGLLTDLMGQMRDAKLMLFQTVDEVDGRISKRVDRIEAEMHSKLLSEIEGRVQERVRAMEQTSSRLEKCFDRMEGRLGALETVLASRRPRPESMYQLLQQQLQQQQQEEEENGVVVPSHAGTFAGFSSSPSSNYRSVTSMLFTAPESGSAQHIKPRRRTLAENGIYPENTNSSTTTAANSGASSENSYVPSNGFVPTPIEGFVSPTQARPIWSPVYGISAATPSSNSHNSSISSSAPSVSSPLERGTVIGGRMGTIHAEYIPKTSYVSSKEKSQGSNPTSPTKERSQSSNPASPTKERSQSSNPTSPTKERSQGSVPTTPIIEKFQNAIDAASTSGPSSEQSSSDRSLRPRRVSLSNFDSSSLTALKPVRATATTATATTTATAVTTSAPSSTSIVTTATATTSSSIIKNDGNNDSSSVGKLSVRSSSSSLLTAKLKGPSSSSSSSSSPTATSSKTIQRAMTFDTLHSQTSATSTITKTVKSPVQGPSSYREILHFWKAGGSGSNSGGQSAAV